MIVNPEIERYLLDLLPARDAVLEEMGAAGKGAEVHYSDGSAQNAGRSAH